jgi:hypothetical protein
MNERIEKLAIECTIYTYGVNGELLYEGFDQEKFAILIVEECAAICKDVAERQFNRLYNRESEGAAICYAKIKQRFGVE